MAGLSPGRAPLQPLPAWLSRTSSPTATVDLPYTYATLLPNGVPTLVVTAERVTQYGTDILQLPLTVDPGADVSGQILGDLYTTAGGEATQTIVRELGGTRLFTLGGSSGTRALAGATTAGGSSAPTTVTAMSAAEPSTAVDSRPTTASVSPPPTAQSPPSTLASPTSLHQSTESIGSVAGSFSAALAGATAASTVDSPSVASLSSAYASATSVLSAASLPSSAASRNSSPSSSTAPPGSSLPSTTSYSSSSSFSASPALKDAHSLTRSQLAAAIAAPLIFFLLLLALLFLCCFCLRRRRRRRRIAEEEGLLGSPESQLRRRERSAGVLWEWIPTRAPSRTSGKSGSGRSALSRLTGGLLGSKGGAKSTAGSSPKGSPAESKEKGFSPRSGTASAREGRSPRTDEEKGLLSGGEEGGEGGRDLGVVAGAAGLAAATGASRQGRSYVPQSDPRRYEQAEPFDDVDLTSPRVDLGDETFPSSDYPADSQRLSPPTLLPIQPSSPIRLSRFYDPAGSSANPYFPPSPSSYSTPSRFDPYSSICHSPPVPLAYTAGEATVPLPLGPVRQATSTLSQLWQGYETNSPRTDAGGGVEDEGQRKRESSRLGYLSWSATDGGGGQQQEYTPPQTPDPPALRVIHEGQDDDERSYMGSSEGSRQAQGPRTVVSEGGWLSGRLSGFFPSNRPSRDAPYEADEEEGGDDERDRLTAPGVPRRGSGDTNGSGQSDDFRGLAGGDLFLNSPRWVGTRRRRSSPPPFSSFEPVGSTSVSYDPPVVLHHQSSATSLDPPYRQPRHWSSFATETDSRYHDADSPIFAPTPAESPGSYPASSSVPRVTTVVKGRHQREDSGPMMQKPSTNAPPLPLPSARPLSTVVGRYHDPFADADGDVDDERPAQQHTRQERREYEYGQERDGPDMVEIRQVGEHSG
ncbi:G-protein coupled receptor [Rhodotorula toruloides]|uniref:G-protein coupled receptor n=1 Tax=Rhodotorula toruloides TaxID=5286 RepID=A0A511K946_RHOTO|nr:G-protein coupled receptor [Rhodotorula toruloides]